MKNRPILVSIITVVFNGEKYLEETINSVLNQTYSNIEYIIIDGGSNDGTIDIIKKYENNISRWISKPDKGIYDAMNKGIMMASGELIGMINSDDWYENDCIEKVVSSYVNNRNSIIYGLIRNFRDGIPVNILTIYPEEIFKEMPPHPTCFVPKNIYNKYGLFDLKYKSCADYQFILRLYKENVKFILLEYVLANFRVGGISSNLKSNKESFKMRYEMGFISKSQQLLRTLGIYLVSCLKR